MSCVRSGRNSRWFYHLALSAVIRGTTGEAGLEVLPSEPPLLFSLSLDLSLSSSTFDLSCLPHLIPATRRPQRSAVELMPCNGGQRLGLDLMYGT